MLWQTDTSVSKNSWCYVENHDYKEWGSILHDLIDIVSKNGALLLNIGPRPDGTIPEPEVAMLRAIGGWLDVNGEAIYGTRPWHTYGEGPTQVFEGEFQDTKRDAFTSKDIRFTTRGDVLYAIVLGQPEEKVAIQSLGTDVDLYQRRITSIELLGSDSPVEWSRTSQHLQVCLPHTQTLEPAFVLKIKGA